MSEEITKKEQTIPRRQHETRDEETIELGELVAIVKLQKIFILIVMAAVFILACLYMLQIPPKYESTALIQVENKGEGMSNMLKSLDSSVTSMLGGSGTAVPSEIEAALISSRFILQPTIETLGLNIKISPHYFPIFGSYIAHKYKGNGLNSAWPGFSSYAWGGEKLHIKQFVVPSLYYNKAFKVLVSKDNSYKLYSPSGTLLLESTAGVAAVSNDNSEIPGVRLLISDLQAKSGVEFYVSFQPINETIKEFYEALIITDLGNMRTASISQKSQTGILNLALRGTDQDSLPAVLNTIVYYDIEKNTTKKTAEAQKTLSFLEQQAVVLRNDLDKASTALSNYKSSQGVLGVSAASKALLDQIVDMEKSIEGMKLKKAELLHEFTSKHPYVIALNEQQQKTIKELAILESQVKTLPKSEQKVLSLERDVKVKSQLYLLMLSKVQQLQVIKAGTISDVRVLGLATPSMRLPSKNSLIAFSSLIFGFMLAIAIIFIRHVLTRALDDPDYIEERLGIPLYAILPHSKRQMQLAKEMKRKIPGSGPFVLAAINSKDLAIEGLRSLRTTLQFGLQDAKNNIIAILGSSPSIGKSFVSLNLTYVFADSGKKMLLIDADMRKGRISSYVCQTNSPGLADILGGTVTFEEAKRVLKGGKDGQIDFIPTGKYPDNPSELLFDDTLKKLLDKISPLYDIIIIDTPPVLAVTDSMLIAKHSAINLLLLGSGIENIRSLEHTVKRIHKNQIKVDGLIFNNAKESGRSYGYGYGYGRGCGYYYYDYHADDNNSRKKRGN